jgi:hypothetical protein
MSLRGALQDAKNAALSRPQRNKGKGPAANTREVVVESPIFLIPGLTLVSEDNPLNFSRLATEFLEAAKALLNSQPSQLDSWPLIFLTCQACELYLKAFLRMRDVSAQQLRDRNFFCHDLQPGFKAAKAQGLVMDSAFEHGLETCIKLLGPPYRDREFQYKREFVGKMVPCCYFISVLEDLRRVIRL